MNYPIPNDRVQLLPRQMLELWVVSNVPSTPVLNLLCSAVHLGPQLCTTC